MDPLPPDPLDIVDAFALGSGCGVVAVFGDCYPDSEGPPTTNLSLQISLFFLYRGVISSDDASTSLGGDWEPTLEADPDGDIFSFPLPEPEVVSTLLRPPAVSVSGMCTPRDWLPVCRAAISILSNVGISFSTYDLIA
jgi:hypothetical protein